MTLSLSTWGSQQADQLVRQVTEGSLDTISLPSLSIYELPPSFNMVKKDTIVRVTLRKNMFVEVPKELATLPNLKYLNMDQNLLTSASFRNLVLITSLTNVSLRSNQIVDIPPAITVLTQLDTLDLSENRLVNLPLELLRLPALNTLLATGNAHLRSLPVPLAKIRSKPTLDVPLSFPSDIGKYTAPEVLQYLAEMNRLQLAVDLRSHHAGEESGSKCSVCFKSEGKRTHCRICGNWCCGSCHKLATVHQLQVAEAVPVCQRCINQMLDKNMPVLVRTEASRPPRPNTAVPFIPHADVELFKQLKQVKTDMKALQSTERTLQALLKLYENSMASAFQLELANTQQQLLITRKAQEALGLRFKRLAVLITEKVSASRATARGPATQIDLTLRPHSPKPQARPQQSQPPLSADKESPTKLNLHTASTSSGSPRQWVKVEPDSRPRLKSTVTADVPMAKPVLGGGGNVSPRPHTPIPSVGAATGVRAPSPIPMGSQRSPQATTMRNPSPIPMGSQRSPRPPSPLPSAAAATASQRGTTVYLANAPSTLGNLPPPFDMAPPPAPPDSAALARATAIVAEERSSLDMVPEEEAAKSRDSTASLSLSGMLADLLLRKAHVPSGYSAHKGAQEADPRASAADYGNPIYRSSHALARDTGRVLPAAEVLPQPVALPGDALPLMRQARALFRFKAEKESEMSIKAGDIVIVTDASDPEWWFGFANGASGFFPATYVALLE